MHKKAAWTKNTKTGANDIATVAFKFQSFPKFFVFHSQTTFMLELAHSNIVINK